METKLCNAFFGNSEESAPRYRELIRDFSEADYRSKKSDELAKLVMRNIRAYVEGSTVQDQGQQARSVSGWAFKFLVAEMLMMHGLAPFLRLAEISGNVGSKVDFLLYNESASVVFMCKLSISERWRQPDRAAEKWKELYDGRVVCYLVTGGGDDRGGDRRNMDISDGGIEGIDQCYAADSVELKEILVDLSTRTFSDPRDGDSLVKGKRFDR